MCVCRNQFERLFILWKLFDCVCLFCRLRPIVWMKRAETRWTLDAGKNAPEDNDRPNDNDEKTLSRNKTLEKSTAEENNGDSRCRGKWMGIDDMTSEPTIDCWTITVKLDTKHLCFLQFCQIKDNPVVTAFQSTSRSLWGWPVLWKPVSGSNRIRTTLQCLH